METKFHAKNKKEDHLRQTFICWILLDEKPVLFLWTRPMRNAARCIKTAQLVGLLTFC